VSYILDALKKSEKERQRGTVPDLLTVQDVIRMEPKRRHIWPYAVLAVLLLNAAALIWWSGHRQSEKPKIVAQSTAMRGESGPGLSEEKSIAGPSSEKSKIAEPEGKEPAMDRSHKPEVTKTERDKEALNRIRQNVAAQSKSNAVANLPDEPVRGVEKGSHEEVSSMPPEAATSKQISDTRSPYLTAFAPDGKKVDIKDLPPSIQQNLPAFAVSVSVYSDDPASRMVKVDGQMLQEGQYLADGVKLEEIAKDGVVFSYQNYRFRIGFR
jgi:general secretion pathway protein B